MKSTLKDMEKFLDLEGKVAREICEDLYNSKVKECKTEEDKQKLKKEIKKIKQDVL